ASAPAVESYAAPLSAANETITDYAPDLACGDSSESLDSDLDGLNDFVELCLGTDPFSADTDIDNVSDKLEVDGFLIDGVRWYSNPLQPDSNRDGLQDSSEWEAPIGAASSMDIDGDGVPNLWDRDNDGDNVPDDVDLSPLSATDYRTSFAYESSKGQQAFDGYQYVEFQIQPENSNHLRYSNAPLDWPTFDTEGTIVQYNNSEDDLTLIPFLRLETYPLPDETLLNQYNISYVEQWDGSYSLHVPLTNITDGGNIVAFHAKLVFNPEMLDNIELDNMELVWFVVAEIDSIGETQSELGLTLPTFEEEPKVVDVFVDDFRISGMTVTLSDDVSLAWFGTPNTPNDDRDLFNLLFGMNEAFLEHQNPDLQTVVDRFTSDTTPEAETWGLSATDVEVVSTSTEHIDAAIPYASSALPTFFSDNGYPMTDFTSLVMASEQSIGWHNLDELNETERASGKLTSNLTDIDLNVTRHLSLVGYEFQSGWQSLPTRETLLKAQERYDDVSTELTALQSDYPDLTADELKTVIHLLYSSWLAGRLSIIETGGLPLVAATADDDAITAEYQLINTPNLIIYLVKSLELAKQGGGFALTTTSDRYRYIRQDESTVITYSAAVNAGYVAQLFGEDGYEAFFHSVFLGWGLVYVKTANTAL
ncbi:MAG: hypothetical protein GY935_11950, partial [Gammaproteobacteria bacterium]|nr:hypothetical protein [Gammaproteobacteria bacterium]